MISVADVALKGDFQEQIKAAFWGDSENALHQ
jgi:hypothetical protein